MYTGPPEDRRLVLNDFKLGRLDIGQQALTENLGIPPLTWTCSVVTSFDTARGDIDFLCDLQWSVIFVDEAHKLKNPKSKITVAFNRFACEARFGLTGTAIQNSYQELWTVLDWSNPKRLGSMKEWTYYVSRRLAIGQSASATDGERAVARVRVTNNKRFTMTDR